MAKRAPLHAASLRAPAAPGADEAVADLARRAADFHADWAARGRPPLGEALRLHFNPEERYDARWSVDALLGADDGERLGAALDAGFPIEAPIAFARGSLLSAAAAMAAPRCAALLAQRGALIGSLNEHWDCPLELACQEAGSNERGILAAAALLRAGALPSARGRAVQARAAWEALGSTGEEPAARFPPLGRCALGSLGNDWDQVELWARGEGGMGVERAIREAASRCERLRKLCAQSQDEFYGLSAEPLRTALARWDMPSEIAAAIEVIAESGSLWSSVAPARSSAGPARL